MKKTVILISIVVTISACRGPLSKPGTTEAPAETTMENKAATPGKAVIEKQNVTIEKAEGITTIGELYADLKKYNGATIRVKGKVTKVNPAIMNKNWVHIQDGTEFNGQFDLTITTDQEFEMGSVVTVEGRITLDKNFGYGYSYKVLLEDGKLVQ